MRYPISQVIGLTVTAAVSDMSSSLYAFIFCLSEGGGADSNFLVLHWENKEFISIFTFVIFAFSL